MLDTSYRSTIETVRQIVPSGAPPQPFCNVGYPMFIGEQGQVVNFDPIAMAVYAIGIFGRIGCGKSALAKVLAMLVAQRQTATGQLPRISVDIQKHNLDEPEYWRLLQTIDPLAQPIVMAGAGFNLLDPLFGFSVDDFVGLLALVFMHQTGRAVDPLQSAILADIVTQIVGMPFDQRHNATLINLLNQKDRQLRTQTGQVMNISTEAVNRATENLLLVFNGLALGDSGLVFGSTKSLYKHMTGRAVGFDLNDLPDPIKRLVHAVRLFLTAHIRELDGQPLTYSLTIADEAWANLTDPVYAHALMAAIKKIRERANLIAVLLHRYSHLLDISTDTRTIAQDLQAMFFGCTEKDEAEFLGKTFGLPQRVVETLPSLPVGWFYFVSREVRPDGSPWPVVLVNLQLTPTAKAVCYTDKGGDTARGLGDAK